MCRFPFSLPVTVLRFIARPTAAAFRFFVFHLAIIALVAIMVSAGAGVATAKDGQVDRNPSLVSIMSSCTAPKPGAALPRYSMEQDDGPRRGAGFALALLAVAMALVGHRDRKKGPTTRAELDRQRQGLWEKTAREVDDVVARYHAEFPKHRGKSIGAVYARYSTRHQDSIADQVRKILEEAIRLEVYVPREYVFFDLAVRGFKRQRKGLGQLRDVLRSKKVGTLLLFATNRLFRKVYRTLEFVDQVHKGWGIRCVFVKSGVDTDDKKRWEMILHAQSMIDQFVVTMYVENIRAAHEGLLEKRLVFGTVSFGYRGEPIDGEFTVHGKPRCQIAIDDATAKVVRDVYRWYVDEGVTINGIIRRLNDDPNVPLPPRSLSGAWTRQSVLRLLKNTRYRGLWKYGITEAVYVPEGDYVRQKVRVKPLKEIQIDELRIVDDEQWYAAQRRLADEGKCNRGRRPADGDRRRRPRLLNGLFRCPEHDRHLHVGGPNGYSMHCARCQGISAETRPLFSLLNRELAMRLTCQALADLMRADDELVEEIVNACREEAVVQQQPDPTRLQQLRTNEQKLQRAIDFNRRNPGDTEEQQADTARFLRQLQFERNDTLHEIAALEKARKQTIAVPTTGDLRSLMGKLHDILQSAAEGDVDEDTRIARDIIELMTGGHIDLCQMGERAPKRGWLQGRFRVDVVSVLVEKVTGVRPSGENGSLEVVIDYRRERLIDRQAEEAKRLWDEGLLNNEIARTMGRKPSYVGKLLDYWFAARGLTRPDGRKRRMELKKKQSKVPEYQKIADDVVALVNDGWSDSSIARKFSVSEPTVISALRWWHDSRGLSVPTAADRRGAVLQRAKGMLDDGMLIKDIAAETGYSPRGLKLALDGYFSDKGERLPDGRALRGNAKSGQRACGHATCGRQRRDRDGDHGLHIESDALPDLPSATRA